MNVTKKTLAGIAEQKGVKVSALIKKLRRGGKEVPDENTELSPELITFLTTDRRKVNTEKVKPSVRPITPKKNKKPSKGFKISFPKTEWKKVVPVLPLPMLGLAASWGVYHFSVHFVPPLVAVAESMGFELVYIGLAFTKSLREDLRNRVLKVSLSAVGVSVIYNSISAALYAKTGGDMEQSRIIIKTIHPILFWLLAIGHGAPLAVLGFFVADLNLHKKKND